MTDISAAQDKSLCKLSLRAINAPFNIMGLPAFNDYYVTHDFVNNTMAIGPHADSNREDLEPVLDPIVQEFKVKMETENEE